VAILKDAAHGHGKLFTAVVAHEQTGTSGVTGNASGVLALAVWANRAVRPEQAFQVLAGCFFCKFRDFSQIHRFHAYTLPVVGCFVKGIIPNDFTQTGTL
jgi:hypothetical protein